MPPEVWMRGAIDGIAPALQPVAHSLLQVREEVLALAATLTLAQASARPFGAASIEFHLRHIAGSLDRLLTYARGETLSEQQLAALSSESAPNASDVEALAAIATDAIDRALDEIREWSTRESQLFDARSVGRQRLPSTVIGLLFHAAEHAQRHAGQIATTARITSALAHST